MKRCAMVALSLAAAACGSAPASPAPAPPAHVESPVPEASITTVQFTAEAEARLAIETATVAEGAVPAVRLVGGEVVVPPGRALAVTAPIAGVVRALPGATPVLPGSTVHRGDALFRLVPLAPVDRDVRARADREVLAATATLEAAEARMTRTEQLVAERASSQRVLEEVTAARDVARADLGVAERRARTVRSSPLLADVSLTVRAPDDGIVRLLSVAPEQAVAQGAPLLEIVAVEALEIRVPVYAGDLARIDLARPASAHRLGAPAGDRTSVLPIAGPPTADPLNVTVDRFYALPSDAGFAPGERALVELPLLEEENARTMPWASIVLDAEGSAWAYACAGEHAYRRVRVDPIRRAGDLAVFARGPARGTCVASVGAAEIFGTEFEPGH